MVRIRKRAGVPKRDLRPETVNACTSCRTRSRPLPASVASVEVVDTFSQQVACDLFFGYRIFYMSDRCTRWRAAISKCLAYTSISAEGRPAGRIPGHICACSQTPLERRRTDRTLHAKSVAYLLCPAALTKCLRAPRCATCSLTSPGSSGRLCAPRSAPS